MPATDITEREQLPLIHDVIMATGEGALPLGEKQNLYEETCLHTPGMGVALGKEMIKTINGQQRKIGNCEDGLKAAMKNMKKLEEVLEQYMLPPLQIGLYLGTDETREAPAGLVYHGNSCSVIPLGDGFDKTSFKRGDEVLLNRDGNLVIGKSYLNAMSHGHTVSYISKLDDGRALVRYRDEHMVIGLSESIAAESLEEGNLIRWHEGASLGLEKVDKPEASEFVVESVPDVSANSIGGQDDNLKQLEDYVKIRIQQPKLARQYGLNGQCTILLIGPPGTGKTQYAKVAAAMVQRILNEPCPFMPVKPGQFENPYVGVSQQNIREAFAVVRKAGRGVIFLDEIESIGRARGIQTNHHSDKSLGALLAELQGFDADMDNQVIVIAATNRVDLLDSALLDRMELQLHIDRPDRSGAESIFNIHLPKDRICTQSGLSGYSVTQIQAIFDQA